MSLRMWSYDLAREQCPNLDHLRRLARFSLDSGYNAWGLYLEHRFAYPSTPWAHGVDVVTPEVIRSLQREFPELAIVPMVNVLAHVEGFLYTEQGKAWHEQRFTGLSGCPCHPDFAAFGVQLVQDVLEVFDSEIVHVGGDETAQLGQCPRCHARLEALGGDDPKARLYAEFYGPLLEQVKAAGRRPALWGDMLLEHPDALAQLDRSTLIFDWQYFGPFTDSVSRFRQNGFEVVASPTLHLYNSMWMNLDQAEANVRDAWATADTLGVCVTTWEAALIGNYETVLPALAWANRVSEGSPERLVEAYGDWGKSMGQDLVNLGGMFSAGKIRSGLRVRLLLMGNPFLAWKHHGEELAGPIGEQALWIADRATQAAKDVHQRGIAQLLRLAVEFVRQVELAAQAYARREPGAALAALAPTRSLFDELEKIATATQLNVGGSRADVERCRHAKRWVETVMLRIQSYGDGSLGYLPSFDSLIMPGFTPHDQGCWWRINRWAQE